MSDTQLVGLGLPKGVKALIQSYHLLDGVYDELMGADGALRPAWSDMLRSLSGLGDAELGRRSQAVGRRVREVGAYHRVYVGEQRAERTWPLTFLPLVLGADDWSLIERGLIQRANLLEAACADFYGPQNTIRSGAVPAAVVAGSPDFLRPMVGIQPPSGKYLRLYAADLGRGPDGRWWVLEDFTQAPSGAGYALGNRLAVSRTLPEAMRDLNIQRLAGFFNQFRLGLSNLSQTASSGVCLLTPGPYAETYFEHAFLARYLGIPLVEGDDLAVRDDVVFLRTVAGLQKVDVLIRRLDADFADPLELNPNSMLGAPGLVEACRQGKITLANALGSGVLESRALMAFWPRLSQDLLGEDLIIPNIATWWCGQAFAREQVGQRLDEIGLASAFGQTVQGLNRRGPVNGRKLTDGERAIIRDRLADRGMDYVGQELVRLSTTPVYAQGTLSPRPFILRVFLAATEDGYRLMPGGMCRLSSEMDPHAISMNRDGFSADVWVPGSQPIVPVSLLPSIDTVDVRRIEGALTSRTADNMFWLGRYVERAEGTLRVARALLNREDQAGPNVDFVRNALIRTLLFWGALPLPDKPSDKNGKGAKAPAGEPPLPSVATAIATTLERSDLFGTVPANVGSALRAASAIRDRLSPDAWRTINDLSATVNSVEDRDAFEKVDLLLRLLSAFSGLAMENVTRSTGWVILDIGRRIERALILTQLMQALHMGQNSPFAVQDALLEIGDSQMTYARRYFVTSSPLGVADLLLLDETNPRGVLFQVQQLRKLAEQLPKSAHTEAGTLFRRSVIALDSLLGEPDAKLAGPVFLSRLTSALLHVGDTFSTLYLANRDLIAPTGVGQA